MQVIDILSIIAIVCTGWLVATELKRDLMMFQQNSYRPERFMKWLRESGDTTSFARLVGMFVFLFSMAGFGVAKFAALCVSLYAIVIALRLATRRYKKPLVFTCRACRLYGTSIIIATVIVGIVIAAVFFGALGTARPLYASMVAMLFCYCISHGLIMAAAFVLRPVENRINRRYYDEAAGMLAGHPGLRVIGVTGSYGKTSTKHFLHRILSEQYETLMTPGSFNTTLGVVRTIRESLKPYHEIFIVEMGAKQPGDIREICELVHPHQGIITAVGPQHLQTFGTVENVLATKFELADAISSDGTVFVNNDYPIIAERAVTNCRAVRYSIEEGTTADYRATNIEYTATGTRFEVTGPKLAGVSFETRLLGRYNISDLVGAIAVAVETGMPVEKIRYAVTRIEPVEHRLSVIRHVGGLTILDDAYNSNPAGAEMALEVLASMRGGRRYILTPGMIELGERQYELNCEFGERIASSGIEYALIICDYNREAILDGLARGGMSSEKIKTFDTFLDANAWLVAQARTGDVALIENDLPDTFK